MQSIVSDQPVRAAQADLKRHLTQTSESPFPRVARHILPYIKKYIYISNEVGKIDSLRALARKLSFLPTESDIFDIRQHYVRILFIFQHLIC